MASMPSTKASLQTKRHLVGYRQPKHHLIPCRTSLLINCFSRQLMIMLTMAIIMFIVMQTKPRSNRVQVPPKDELPLVVPDPTEHQAALQRDASVNRVRQQLALMMTMLVIVLAVLAGVQTDALSVLQILLPLISTMFGFFFGYKISKP